ncbi:MAG TPA: hypothetical protein VEC35_16355 [Noviherbaspirillum sp.]|nr:hypothetical protein [Noviherbaspirillum sp.]
MNAPLSVMERFAIASASLPFGFLDENDVPIKILDQWHESQRPAKLPPPPTPATEAGRKACAALIAKCRAKAPTPQMRRSQFIGLTSWHDTPRDYRRVVAHLAGLPETVIDKYDRNLSENEKCLLRTAARNLRDQVAALAGSI